MVKSAQKKIRVNEEGDSSPSPTGGASESLETTLLTKYAADFGHCELRACIANTGTDNKNAKLIMMNTSAIPCCAEKCREVGCLALFRFNFAGANRFRVPVQDEKKSTPVKLTLIHVQAAGFSAAPYAVPFGGGKGKIGENAKPLTAVETIDDGVRRPGLRMWPFKKETMPGNRGPRYDEKSFVLECGDTFVLFVGKMDFMKNPQYGDNPNSLFPKDVEEIPAFSLLEVHVMSKPGDPTMNRENMLVPRMSCVRFCMVRPCVNSLYSYGSSLDAFPGTLEQAKQNAFAKREKYEVISKDIECDNVSFVARAAAKYATISDQYLESDGIVSVVGWSEDPMDQGVTLDIPSDILLRYTNSSSMQWLMTLLELALNMECVTFTVFTSDYFRRGTGLSHFRAIPVLNTRKMLDVIRLDGGGGTA
eukprot:17607-Rhodomonas_salina.1